MCLRLRRKAVHERVVHVRVGQTYGSRWTSKGQTQQHQQRNELIARLHVGHREVAVMATEAHHCRGQDIRQLQEVQGDQGGQDDGELDRYGRTQIKAPDRNEAEQHFPCVISTFNHELSNSRPHV